MNFQNKTIEELEAELSPLQSDWIDDQGKRTIQQIHYLTKISRSFTLHHGMHRSDPAEILIGIIGDIFVLEWVNQSPNIRYYPIKDLEK